MSEEELAIAEIGRTLVRLEGMFDRVTADHESRLRYLEKAIWVATGLGSAALASAVATLVGVVR